MKPAYIRCDEDFSKVVRYGITHESEVLEFKAQYNAKQPDVKSEIRKDVLALANTWGGVLLIGVVEGGDKLDIATDAVTIDADDHKKRITDVLSSKVFPPLDVDPVVLNVPALNGDVVRILAVNVAPFANGVGCLDDGDGRLKFPKRDSRGVKWIPPMEVFAMMASNPARRIEIALNELAKPGIEIHIASPVLRQHLEDELIARQRLEAARSTKLDIRAQFDGNPARKIYETPARNVRAEFDSSTSRAMTVVIRSDDGDAVVSVPLGLIREVWPLDANRLGIVLDCEIVIAGEQNRSVLVRTR